MGDVLQLLAQSEPRPGCVRCSFCGTEAAKVPAIIQSQDSHASICASCLVEATNAAFGYLDRLRSGK